MKRKTAKTATILFSLIPAALFAQAQNSAEDSVGAEEGGVKTLDAYEVTALRFADSVFDVPASTQNISSDAIEKSGLVSVPDVLRRHAGVNVRNTGLSPFTAELSMRGFGENSGQRVMVIVDGQRLNTLDLSFINWAQLPLENIENIEVMRGPQTAAYGNYAESGVVKITTKRWNLRRVPGVRARLAFRRRLLRLRFRKLLPQQRLR